MSVRRTRWRRRLGWSLVLAGALAAAAWVASGWVSVIWEPGWHLRLQLTSGCFEFARLDPVYSTTRSRVRLDRVSMEVRRIGNIQFEWRAGRIGATAGWLVRVPLWWLPPVLAGGGVLALRAGRRTGGECAACGYDRAGLPAGAPCPECGVVPAGAP